MDQYSQPWNKSPHFGQSPGGCLGEDPGGGEAGGLRGDLPGRGHQRAAELPPGGVQLHDPLQAGVADNMAAGQKPMVGAPLGVRNGNFDPWPHLKQAELLFKRKPGETASSQRLGFYLSWWGPSLQAGAGGLEVAGAVVRAGPGDHGRLCAAGRNWAGFRFPVAFS